MSKKLITRISNKADYEINWLNAETFVPFKGEMIIYKSEYKWDSVAEKYVEDTSIKIPTNRTERFSCARIKVGDGVNYLADLPFVTGVPNSDEPKPVVLTGITVTAPAKITYTVGDTLDTTGMVVTANYSNDTKTNVTASATVNVTTLTEAGTKTVTVTYEGFTDTFEVTVDYIKVEPPVVSDLIYNTDYQSPTISGIDSNIVEYIIPSEINAGTYKTVFTIKAEYQDSYRFFEDTDRNNSCEVSWKIQKAENLYIKIAEGSETKFTFNISDVETTKEITLEHSPLQINSATESITFMSADGLDMDYLYYNWERIGETTSRFTLTCLNYYKGENIPDPEGTNFTFLIGVYSPNYVEEYTEYLTVKINYNLPKRELDKNSWEVISATSKAGMAPTLWSIGDYKAIQLNGYLQSTYPDDTYTLNDSENNINRYVYIIGFDHNIDLEKSGYEHCIDFGCFKEIKTDGETVTTTSYCLASDKYGQESVTCWGAWSGGSLYSWNNCDIRSVLLGSNYEPEDAPNGSLLAAFPEDLKKTMKKMKKYTDNTGPREENYDPKQSKVTSTEEYLPLMSAHECTGEKYSNTVNYFESLYQKQYSYYQSGNSASNIKTYMKLSENVINDSNKEHWGVYWTRTFSYSKLSGDQTQYHFVASETGSSVSLGYGRYPECKGINPIFRV